MVRQSRLPIRFQGTQRTFRRASKRSFISVGLATTLVAVLFALAPAPASAVGSYDNAAIADIALKYVGQYGGAACVDAGRSGYTGGAPLGAGNNDDGECRAFINCVVWMASGHTQWLGGGADYFAAFLREGGQEITDVNQLTKGDIVQAGQGTHTFIIVSRVSGGTFSVVDSNHALDHKVASYQRTFSLSSTERAFRMGTVGGSGGLSNGQFVSYNGYVFRVVGGAPVYVSSWDAVGGPQATTALTASQFGALRTYPADGTFVVGNGNVYRFVGGAPLYVSSWNDVGGPQAAIQIDQAAIDQGGNPSPPWNHVLKYPSDGTVVAANGYVYRFVGGAPLYISSWNDIGGPVPATAVSQSALDAGGSTVAPWNHVAKYPVDGTLIAASGFVYRFAGGAPLYVSSWSDIGGPQPATAVSQSTLDQGGVTATPWGHVSRYPVDGTLVNVPSGTVYRFAGGAPLAVSTWSAIGGPQASTRTSESPLINGGVTGAPWGHVLKFPIAGTQLNDLNGANTWLVQSDGTATPTNRTTGILIDRAALDNAGLPSPWNHLQSTVPRARLNALPTSTTGTSVTVSWPLLVTASRTTSYDVRLRSCTPSGCGSWVQPSTWQGLAAGPVTRSSLIGGRKYCFENRAHDVAGLTGPWSPQTCIAKPLGTIKNSVLPSISGTRKVGYTLTATVGTWSPGSLTYHYQWYRDSTAISGATAKTYKLTSASRGHKIRVKVTATRTGYTSLTKYSAYTVLIK